MHRDRVVTGRRRRQRGNALIEMAIVMAPLFALFFGIIDFSLALFVKATLQNAVREGVRYAITYQTDGGGQDNSIRAVVQQNAMGFLNGTSGWSKIQINFYSYNKVTKQFVLATGAGSNAPGNLVEVLVSEYPWNWIAPISGSLDTGKQYRSTSTLKVSAAASDVMGGLPVGASSPPAR